MAELTITLRYDSDDEKRLLEALGEIGGATNDLWYEATVNHNETLAEVYRGIEADIGYAVERLHASINAPPPVSFVDRLRSAQGTVPA